MSNPAPCKTRSSTRGEDEHRLLSGDCLTHLRRLAPESVDLVCTDPPYGIGFMGKEWDTFPPECLAPMTNPGSRCRQASASFRDAARGGKYDNGVQARQSFYEFMRAVGVELLRVMKPGAFLFMTMTPRQDCLARVQMALEDAGFNIGFTSLYWTFASGFPKAASIAKAVDKRLGAEREVIGTRVLHDIRGNRYGSKNANFIAEVRGNAASDAAKALDGAYAGFQPKPAVEVVIVAMKPLSEKTFVDQALQNRKGVTWLDQCRFPITDQTGVWGTSNETVAAGRMFNSSPNGRDYRSVEHPRGRFPANLCVSDDALGAHSRYFSLDAWSTSLPFLIVPKASKKEKNAGLGNRPVCASELRLGSIGRPSSVKRRRAATGANASATKNNHPTVKPLQLMAYLITLGSRPGDLVLDPFLGSGTTAVAAKLLGRRAIGIERERAYLEIARERLAAVR